MPKIKFSHIFNDYFERILECFSELNIDTFHQNSITKLKFEKGQRLDEENAEFSFIWKNYYEIKMVVEKVIKQQFNKSYTHRATYIDKLPIEISLTFNFVWDSINENTIFILDLDYQDEFFTDLIKADFSEEDKLNLCKAIENYLSTSLKGLETTSSCYVNSTLEKARKYLLFPNAFFKIISKDLLFIPKENEVSVDETYELFTKSEDSQNYIPITVYIVTNLYISSTYIRITYTTYKKISLPNIKLSFTLKQLEGKKCLFIINIKPNEPTTYEMNCNVYKFWKKRALEFSNFFEKKKKKKEN